MSFSFLNIFLTAVASVCGVPALLYALMRWRINNARKRIRWVGSAAAEAIFTYNPTWTCANDFATEGAKRADAPLKRQVPASPPLMSFGVVWSFLRRDRPGYVQCTRNHDNLGNVLFFSLFGLYNMIQIADAESARKVLSDVSTFEHTNPGTAGYFYSQFIGKNNVVTSNGEDWIQQRRLLDPSFVNIERFAPILERCVQLCLQQFENTQENTVISSLNHCIKENEYVIELKPFLHRMTLDVLGQAIFGHDFGALRGDRGAELRAYKTLAADGLQILDVLFPTLWHRVPTQKNKQLHEAVSVLNRLIFGLIEQSKEKQKNGMCSGDQPQSVADPTSLLDMMVEASMDGDISTELLRANAVLLSFAGHETTANSASFAVATLATNATVQQRLYEALKADAIDDESSSSSSSTTSNYTRIMNCRYLDNFVKEVLRRQGPIGQLPTRLVTKDTELAGFFIPKGTVVSISTHAIHHNERYYDRPYEFDPDRFLPQNSKGRPSTAYMPFGSGKRVCVGMQLALAELKHLLASLVLRYEVLPVSGFEQVSPAPDTFLTELAHKFQVRLKRRV